MEGIQGYFLRASDILPAPVIGERDRFGKGHEGGRKFLGDVILNSPVFIGYEEFKMEPVVYFIFAAPNLGHYYAFY